MTFCLIVDDSSVVRRMARRMLEQLGMECGEAENGAEALEMCRQRMPDVVLLDWNMPVMNGIECVGRLREMPGAAAAKVVFCTTQNDLESIRGALAAGADEYIMKPFDAEMFNDKFRQIGILRGAS